jgi:predicted TIM-barrel fold metal-dependent hydrolase
MKIKTYVENIKKLEMDEKNKELMLGGNAKRLLKL